MYYTRQEYEYEIMNELIEKEMHNTKGLALKKLSSLVAHSNDLEAFGNILAYSWFDSLPHANKLADQLDLCKLDFLAIQEELHAFKEEYLKCVDQFQNF